jgi:glycosyltransferase involved in cell wall biosynthesis
MPAYDAERYLREAVESVLGQELRDLELIVCDDGSVDATGDVLAGVEDARLRIVVQEHRGIASALNAALAQARGRYIARLDADDVWEPDLLSVLVPVLDADPRLGLVYASCRGILEDGAASGERRGTPPRYPEDAFRSLLLCDHTACVTCVMPRRAVEEVGAWREDAEQNEDWDLALRLARRHPVRFVDRVLARIREHPGATTAVGRPGLDRRLRNRRQVLEWHFDRPDLPGHIRRLRPRALRNLYVGEGLQRLARGDRRRARSAFGRAIREGGNPLRTFGRIVWSSFDWFCLDHVPGARRWAQRAMDWRRAQPAASGREGR